MKITKPKVALSVLIAAVGLLAGACKNSQPAAKPPAPGAVEVTAIAVQAQSLSPSTELPGRTAAYRVAEIRPQVSGIVQKRLFTEGSEVKAGDLLYQIDPASYEASLASAEASLARSEAMEYSARLKADRYRNLVRNKAVSDQEQIDAEASWKQAQAEIAAAKAAVQTARINLAYTRISAPIGGRIGKSQITEGALVTAQQATALATIQQLDPVYVDVSQSANDLLKLKRKLAAEQNQPTDKLKTEVTVIYDDGSEHATKGSLEFADVSVEQSTGTVTVRAIVGNPGHELLPGMFVRARLVADHPQQLILIPQATVVRNNRGQALAMLVSDKAVVEARPIETGQNIGDQIVVLSGLKVGEQLITSGLQKIRPGAPVKVAVSATGGEAKAAPANSQTAQKAE